MQKMFFINVVLCFIFVSNISLASEFTDIENHWAKELIEDGVKDEVIKGYGDETFRPDESMTIAEYLKVLVKSGQLVLINEGKSLWPYYYLSTARINELINENEFPVDNKNITRYEVARITARYIPEIDNNMYKNKFNDIDDEYLSEILKLEKLGVICGYEDNTFRGNNEVTRAEAVAIAKRATVRRRELISQKEYNISKEIAFNNFGRLGNVRGDFAKTRYEIENNKILIFDSGRYSKLQNYEIDDKLLDIKKVCKIINTLVDKDSYTAVLYNPFENIINQLIVTYGENESLVHQGVSSFTLIYYEDKPYELRRISGQDALSERCYMKIEVLKMWRDYSEYCKGNYIDEYKKEKFRKCLEIEFGEKHANDMLEYMLEKNALRVSRTGEEGLQIEQKKFGKYIVNYYKRAGDTVKFYIAVEE